MLHARVLQPVEAPQGEVVAFPLRGEFGRRAQARRFSLVMDLHAEEGARWWRGAATLTALCGAAFLLAPDFQPLVPARAEAATIRHQDLAAFAPAPAAVPQFTMPTTRGLRAGEQGGLKRVSGDVAGGLYWSLRGAGASPQLAADYLKAIATAIDVGDVAPYDRFEFVVAKGSGALAYAGLDRAQGSDVKLIRWTANGRSGWFDGEASAAPGSSGLMAPVAGRITSHFGNRVHPILRFSRFHGGIDFGARWGSPIVAAADGVVAGAGWNGGYGRQVQVVHGGGIATSYSHMSAIAAAPGTPVRQGQVIGYVGSSGLSTGPHLHFEVRAGGRPVNPLTARLVTRPQVDKAQAAAFKAKLKALQAIPVAPVAAAPAV